MAITTTNPHPSNVLPGAHASTHHTGGGDLLAHQSVPGSGTNTHAQVDTHLGAATPHSGHENTANKGIANGYPSLDASVLVPLAQIPATLTGKDADSVDGVQGASIVRNDQNNVLGAFYEDLAQIATPANPAAGTRRLFTDSADGKLKARTSAGVSVSLEESGSGYAINVLGGSTTFDPANTATYYFGMYPKSPETIAARNKVYVRRAGTIKIAEIYWYATNIVGGGQSFSIYVRVNNTTDTLIATIGAATAEKIFSNAALNIAVNAGNYFEIKVVTPSWSPDPPTGVVLSGYVYIE